MQPRQTGAVYQFQNRSPLAGGVAAEKVAAAAEAKGKEAGEKSRQLSWARNKKNKAELVAILRQARPTTLPAVSLPCIDAAINSCEGADASRWLQVAGDANIEGQGDPYLTRTPTERKAKTRQVKETLKMMYYDSVKDKTCPEPYVLWCDSAPLAPRATSFPRTRTAAC